MSKVLGVGFESLGCRVWGLGFETVSVCVCVSKVEGSEFRVWGES